MVFNGRFALKLISVTGVKLNGVTHLLLYGVNTLYTVTVL
jgi:hypothetical protein